MKSVFLTLLSICLLTACKQPPVPLQIYNVTLSGMEADLIGEPMRSTTISDDTIMCINDTIAYEQALFKYYGRLSAERKTANAISKTESFIVTDSTGLNLRVKLDLRVTDSLDASIRKLPSIKALFAKD